MTILSTDASYYYVKKMKKLLRNKNQRHQVIAFKIWKNGYYVITFLRIKTNNDFFYIIAVFFTLRLKRKKRILRLFLVLREINQKVSIFHSKWSLHYA